MAEAMKPIQRANGPEIALVSNAHPRMVLRLAYDSALGQATAKVANWFEAEIHKDKEPVKSAMAEFVIRREKVLGQLNSRPGLNSRPIEITIKPFSRLILGTGSDASPTGLCLPLHVPTGIPYIPAASLRGVARRGCRSVKGLSDSADEIFGTIDKPGVVSLLDAMPVRGLCLVQEVITPHHAQYRSKKAEPNGLESPIPIAQLAISAGTFATALVPAPGCTQEQLCCAWKALQAGLDEEGLGARTSSGFGYVTATTSSTAQEACQ